MLSAVAAGSRCLLQTTSTYGSEGHAGVSQDIYLSNIARSGVGFIHGAQLFPGERCTLHLNDTARLNLEGALCYLADELE